MEKIIVKEMDGISCGFAIYSYKQDKILTKKNGQFLLFRNEQNAKIYAFQIKKYTNPLDYDLYIFIEDTPILFDYFYRVGDYYQLFAEDAKYFIKPVEGYKLDRVGYFVFRNEIDTTMSHSESSAYSTECMKAIVESASRLAQQPKRVPTVESVTRKGGMYFINLKGTSEQIVIMYNYVIVAINKSRQSRGYNVFKYDRNIDRYGSLYVMIRGSYDDLSKKNPKEQIENCRSIIDTIVEDVKQQYPELTYKNIPLEYNPYIYKYDLDYKYFLNKAQKNKREEVKNNDGTDSNKS